MVIYDLEFRSFGCRLQDGLDEVLAMVAVKPGSSDDVEPVEHLLEMLFASIFAAAVDTLRVGGVVLVISRALRAVEDVIRAH
ncbi:hypothetical protein D3C87_1061260 [compost metagenome]